MLPVHLYSAKTLEPWDWTTPWTTGIGGSEQSHLEAAIRLSNRRDLSVFSYIPMAQSSDVSTTPLRASWRESEAFKTVLESPEPGIFINYRDPEAFKHPKVDGHKYWFIAQDVDYAWDNETLAKVDRYICLCREHAHHTLKKYKALRGKVFVSSNGIRTDFIEHFEQQNPQIQRVPYRMLYASSPDRGLKLLLEQWWRIRERFPEATLNVAYGFNNIDTIIKAFGDRDRLALREDLNRLLHQDGVTWLGRLNVTQLLTEHFSSQVYASPSDWPETSGISYMEAMACGNFPVTTNYWAQGENVQHGWKVDGLPQKSELVRQLWLSNLYDALEQTDHNPQKGPPRCEMMAWARENFNWERIVDQWVLWIKEDSK